MSRTRLLVVGAIALLAFSGVAQAQVAAPVLTPGTVDLTGANPGFVADPSFVPNNPSVMSWNGGSVFGLGQARTESETSGPPAETREFSSTYAGLRWTGEKFAIGVETVNLESQTSDVDLKVSSTSVGLSGKLAEWFSLGISLGSAKADFGASDETVTGWTVGGTARFGDIFYVGLGMGRDSVDHKETNNNYNDDRSTSQYGLGLYTGGGKGSAGGAVWHLEYSVEEKDDFETSAGLKVDGYNRTTGTVEVIWKSILASYSTYSVAAKTGNATMDGSAVEVGWVSDKSFYVTVRLQKGSEGGSDNTNKADANTQAINVGLQF